MKEWAPGNRPGIQAPVPKRPGALSGTVSYFYIQVGNAHTKITKIVQNEMTQSALNKVRTGDKKSNRKPSGNGDGSCQAPTKKIQFRAKKNTHTQRRKLSNQTLSGRLVGVAGAGVRAGAEANLPTCGRWPWGGVGARTFALRLVIKLIFTSRRGLHSQLPDIGDTSSDSDRDFAPRQPVLLLSASSFFGLFVFFVLFFFGSTSICCQARYIISDIIKTFLACKKKI